MMSRFPEWLPDIVAVTASKYRAVNRKLVVRVATDGRMRAVWRELGRCERATPGALAMFFMFACSYAITQTKALPISELTDLRKACKHQAALLRASAEFLRKVEELSILLDPAFSSAKARGFRRGTAESDEDVSADGDFYADEVEDAAAYFDEAAAAIARLCTDGHPLIVDRDQGNLGPRGYVRALAAKVRLIFGSPLYGTLATTANVVLLPSTPVTHKHVRNWCSADKDL